jgi:regulator of cell morphogenesis and NO signaling
MVCEEHHIPFADLAREIEASARERQDGDRDWTGEPLHKLVDHIVATYHTPLREEMPRLEQMAARVLRVHAAKAPELLGRIEEIVGELSADLRDHIRKEELVLFPAICAQDTGDWTGRAVPVSAHHCDGTGARSRG